MTSRVKLLRPRKYPELEEILTHDIQILIFIDLIFPVYLFTCKPLYIFSPLNFRFLFSQISISDSIFAPLLFFAGLNFFKRETQTWDHNLSRFLQAFRSFLQDLTVDSHRKDILQ